MAYYDALLGHNTFLNYGQHPWGPCLPIYRNARARSLCLLFLCAIGSARLSRTSELYLFRVSVIREFRRLEELWHLMVPRPDHVYILHDRWERSQCIHISLTLVQALIAHLT